MASFIDDFIEYYKTTTDYELDCAAPGPVNFPRRMLQSLTAYVQLAALDPELSKPIPGIKAACASIHETLDTGAAS